MIIAGKLSSEHIDIDKNEVKVVRGWPFFKETFMLLSLTGNDIGELKNYIIDNAKPDVGCFLLNNFQECRKQIARFLATRNSIYLETKLELLEGDENGLIATEVLVKCSNVRVAKLIAGAYDGRLRQVIAKRQEDLQNTFRYFVRIKIVLGE
ncbi:hypothetical protein WA026_023110 [Henosepilachna vigintioctopunctata]|uniref:Uncharacterized protein n=1 Tax=Henosepilachna vigintioctopunctata TaxID=420089 RepID=A0AAW1UD75_9CUCU